LISYFDIIHLSDTGKKWEYNGPVLQLCRLQETLVRLRREVSNNIVIKSGASMKLIGLIKIFLNEN